MTCAAIREFGAKLGIVLGLLTMAIKTPAHIHDLRILIYGHLAHIAVAIFTVQSRGNMRSMDKMDKIRNLCDRDPYDGLVFRNGFD